MFHLGSRFLVIQPTDGQKKILSHPATQTFILFCMFFVSTKSLPISLLLITMYYIFMYILTNENHPFYLIPKSWLDEASDHISRPMNYIKNMERLIPLKLNYTFDGSPQ